MNTLIWQLRRVVRRVGAGGVIGLAALALALLLLAVETVPTRARIAEQTQQLAALRASAVARIAPPAPVDATAQPLAHLPPTGEAAEQIGALERLARVHGIPLTRGQYSATPQPGTALTRWQIALPVEAAYPALYAWLATALERIPTLAIDEMKLKRERIESPVLQADLRLSLYVESAP